MDSSKSETEATLKTVESLFSDATAALGVSKFDIAINTVGKVLKKPIVETTGQEFDDMFLVNSKCAFFFIKHAAKNLNEGGTIISLVTSLLGAFAPGYSTYQGSKAPVEWFTKSVAKELQPKNIRVNCVAPGPMDTPFFYGQARRRCFP
ncbi:short-chain dehydrogenase/reductase SDR [Cryptococcus deuterogattii MMRL2647]|nr:short-chain dehydrogenase/reductase SDR [Cryptococcus deuterogattii MMRL2647]